MTSDENISANTAGKPSPGVAKKILGPAIRYGLPLVLTVLLVWYMYTKVNFNQLMEILRRGVDYWWILAAMAVSVFSHIFRAARWRLQLYGLQVKPPFLALCVSIFGTYALNLVFPRLGEIWRCTYIAGRQKAPLPKVMGSMVADRVSDTIMVFLLLMLTFVVATPALMAFLNKYPMGQDLMALIQNPLFWLGAIGAVMAVWIVFVLFRNTRIVKAVKDICRGLWDGFVVVLRMRGRGQFLLLTLCIWCCYFLQLYLAFFAFPFTRDLCSDSGLSFGLTPCLVAFVFSSIGMAIPSNGGLGPWNIAVMFGLSIYGISQENGIAFSILVWSAQTLMLLILGIFTMIYLPLESRRLKREVAPAANEINEIID